MAYVYQADIYCDPCGEKIKEEIKKERADKVPENEDDQYTYDSGDYPKHCEDDDEADTPQHCADCGEFLKNQLTEEGYEYVEQALNDFAVMPKSTEEFAAMGRANLKEWADHYGFKYEENQWESAHQWAECHIQYLMGSVVDEGGIGCDGNALAKLVYMARAFLRKLDADDIQDEYQNEMEEDGFFVKPGWRR